MITHFTQILRETHRRSLWQVLSAYVVAAWFVLQVVDTLTSVLQLPDWFPSLALVLLLVGFPIVLATAFVQSGLGGGGGASTGGYKRCWRQWSRRHRRATGRTFSTLS